MTPACALIDDRRQVERDWRAATDYRGVALADRYGLHDGLDFDFGGEHESPCIMDPSARASVHALANAHVHETEYSQDMSDEPRKPHFLREWRKLKTTER